MTYHYVLILASLVPFILTSCMGPLIFKEVNQQTLRQISFSVCNLLFTQGEVETLSCNSVEELIVQRLKYTEAGEPALDLPPSKEKPLWVWGLTYSGFSSVWVFEFDSFCNWQGFSKKGRKNKKIIYFCCWQSMFFQINQLVPVYSAQLDPNDCAVKPHTAAHLSESSPIADEEF